MDVSLDEGDALLCGRSAQLVVQALAGQRDVPFKAALHTGIVAFTHSTGGQHHVKQLGLVGIAAGRADADDVLYIVELEQLIGINADGRHTHAAAHHADGTALVSAGKAKHAAHAGHLTDILEEGIRNEFCTQGIARHQNGLCKIAFFSADVRGRHKIISPFLYSRGAFRNEKPSAMLLIYICCG